MTIKIKNNKSWIGVPPWVLIGAVAVLLPIFTFMTIESINRQKEKSIQLLLEKGAALIRSFEAGTRFGMMGMHRGGFQLQQLLTETAQQPDIVYLFVAAGVVIIIGTVIMYNLEKGAKNSEMTTLLDALWWCVETVTTVGYGDIVPVTSLGRIVALVYMFFGISLVATLLAVISNTFYKKRILKEETEKKEQDTNYLRNLVMSKLADIERKQSECIETVNRLRSSIENQ